MFESLREDLFCHKSFDTCLGIRSFSHTDLDVLEGILKMRSSYPSHRIDDPIAQSINYSCFENMGRFVTMKNIRSIFWTWCFYLGFRH